ncbi:hypothetical protein QYS49_34895 [Marivirga salinae]|uniref:Uncharacterized protein n=1 Tax=Marivirga salinarum TaxID=3059078 RepID=A0AA51ND22_9BACT|nr:hypothetical protein [Marivirga sp. BDSF4-3]WMN12878.1 hypothetical protein QYS49_34895 [Marivirga sp. BDSF4-3]
MNKLIILIPFLAVFLFNCDGKKTEKASEVETLDEEVPEEEVVDVMEEKGDEVEEVLIDNEYIKAIKVNLKPGEELPWHKGKERVMYPLNDFQVKLKSLTDDDEAKERLFQKGVPNWFQENIHSVKNIGNTPAKYLIVMRKQKSFPEGKMYEVSELKTADGVNVVSLFDNASVRVSRVKLEVGKETSVHKGIYRLTYPLTDYSVVYDKENQTKETRNIFKGVAHWHLPSSHSIKNVSNKGVADFLVFEFKI